MSTNTQIVKAHAGRKIEELTAVATAAEIESKLAGLNKSQKIRLLGSLDWRNGEIARYLNIKPQMVSNVLHRPLKRAE